MTVEAFGSETHCSGRKLNIGSPRAAERGTRIRLRCRQDDDGDGLAGHGGAGTYRLRGEPLGTGQLGIRLYWVMVLDAGVVKAWGRTLETATLWRSMLEPCSLSAAKTLLFRALLWQAILTLSEGWIVLRAPRQWP